jgi:hypothetical protein
MHPQIFKFIILPLVLVCFGLSPALQAANETTINANTGEGDGALQSVTTGSNNTGLGAGALFSLTTGDQNTATGAQALKNNTEANKNTADGFQALVNNSGLAADNNTATGWRALFQNTIGSDNTAAGESALNQNTTGSDNAAVGRRALVNNTTGFNNIALGSGAGRNLTFGANNIDIGNGGVAGEADTIRIGTGGTQTATFIAGISGTAVTGAAVHVNADGQLGTTPSSARFKQEIKLMEKASEVILSLKPVTFHYRKEVDPDGVPQFGLVAEEVEKVNPDLIVRDKEGKPYSVRYEAVNAMLLNEFLKAHRQIEEQQKEIEALRTIIQKVSDKVEMMKPAPQMAENNQ